MANIPSCHFCQTPIIPTHRYWSTDRYRCQRVGCPHYNCSQCQVFNLDCHYQPVPDRPAKETLYFSVCSQVCGGKILEQINPIRLGPLDPDCLNLGSQLILNTVIEFDQFYQLLINVNQTMDKLKPYRSSS